MTATLTSQVDRYRSFYARRTWFRFLFRFDVHYRCRRLKEVLGRLGFDAEHRRVLDVGFGGGHLLRSFPASCELVGAEVSESAVALARQSRAYRRYRSARFHLVPEDDPDALPPGPFDVVVSSHTLEHVPSDLAVLSALRDRITPGGLLCVFLPVEEPGYNPDHVREYSVSSARARIAAAGFDVLFSEGSLHLNGHVWKILTIPSRRRWPVLGPVVDAVRSVSLSMVPYSLHVAFDTELDHRGMGPRQALVIARRPVHLSQDAGAQAR